MIPSGAYANNGKRPEEKEASQGEVGAGDGKRVLHVRNLPLDATEPELAALCGPFGKVTGILLLNTKPQAFVQFETAQAAAALLQHYSGVPAHIRGKTVYFQYSNRDSIGSKPQNETPKPILLVTVSNMLYPVAIELLYSVFSKYGPVVKIVIFTKNGAFQSLIQFMDVNSAINAKTALDGQNLYVGACILRVQYSQLPDLTVKYNNDKSRNFLDPTLPAGPPSSPFTPPNPYGYPAYQMPQQQQAQPQGANRRNQGY